MFVNRGFVTRALLHRAVLLLLVMVTVGGCDRPSERSAASPSPDRQLIVGAVPWPGFFTPSTTSPVGFDADLAEAFARSIGARIQWRLFEHPASLREAVRNARVDIAIGLTPTKDRALRYTPAYLRSQRVIAYRRDTHKPRSLEDLRRRNNGVTVAAGEHGTLGLHPSVTTSTRGAFAALQSDDRTAVLTDEFELRGAQYLYPDASLAFRLDNFVQRAWALPASEETWLSRRARFFLRARQLDDRILQLKRQYLGLLAPHDRVAVHRLKRATSRQLPSFARAFKLAAQRTELDWPFLAAVGYQESLWDPAARSPTGVRGLMMLTERTASEVGVQDRLDPVESIDGGARYLRYLLDRFGGLSGSERLWFAAAAYNVGLGHVRDAQKLTTASGADPRRWHDVRRRLLLLELPSWHRRTRYGAARGREVVRYVGNVQQFYQTLKFLENRQAPLLQE